MGVTEQATVAITKDLVPLSITQDVFSIIQLADGEGCCRFHLLAIKPRPLVVSSLLRVRKIPLLAIAEWGIFYQLRLLFLQEQYSSSHMQPIKRKTSKYPLDMYLNYVQSVGTAVERRLMDITPANKEVFWRWFREEMELAENRMDTCSGQVHKIASSIYD